MSFSVLGVILSLKYIIYKVKQGMSVWKSGGRKNILFKSCLSMSLKMWFGNHFNLDIESVDINSVNSVNTQEENAVH